MSDYVITKFRSRRPIPGQKVFLIKITTVTTPLFFYICRSPRLARREAIQVRTVAIAVLNLRMNFSRCMPNYRPDGPHRGQWGLICPPIYFWHTIH